MAYTTINKSTDYFNTKLYTGTGSNQSLTGVGFKPDFVWTKNRTENSDNRLFDAIRGALYVLTSNNTDTSSSSADTLTSFDTDGFTLGSSFRVNKNTNTFASWNWLANGAGSANTNGSISSTVSASATSGFSIVKYTGTGSTATVGHGLGAVPKMIIYKNLSTTENWVVHHASEGIGKFARLNQTNAFESNSSMTTALSNSLITLGTHAGVNGSGNNIIAYCFADVQGYSKVGGSYTGNGSATNGPFIYTGFKPAFVMVKESSSTGSWCIFDNKRLGYNPNNPRLYPNNAGAEDASETIFDIVSNGFKIRGDQSDTNASGQTYIYMSFAEAPLVGTNNIPCTAR